MTTKSLLLNINNVPVAAHFLNRIINTPINRIVLQNPPPRRAIPPANMLESVVSACLRNPKKYLVPLQESLLLHEALSVVGGQHRQRLLQPSDFGLTTLLALLVAHGFVG